MTAIVHRPTRLWHPDYGRGGLAGGELVGTVELILWIIRATVASARYADARSRKNYAGTSPVTRASGKKKAVLARFVRNRHLAGAVHRQAFCALTASPGARAYYDQLRARGATHNAALRQLSNRLTGILHGCLKTGTPYDEAAAWSHRQQKTAA